MGRIVALDVGDATIGVAATDELGIAAYPVTTIRRTRSIKADLSTLEVLLAELRPEKVIVGIPLGIDNEEGNQALRVKNFTDRLARRLRFPVETWDERFSTQEAEERMIEAGASRARRRKRIHQAAAVIILEGYLREHG